MREILFRGKRPNGKWEQGDLTQFCIDEEVTSKISFHELKATPYGLRVFTYTNEVIPETVGQYTGLTDKNGKKIFEGDIIKSDNGRISAISVVQYGNFEPLMFYDLLKKYVRPRPKEKLYGLFAKSKRGEEMFLSECSHLIEVIGNIHDNPELLEAKE